MLGTLATVVVFGGLYVKGIHDIIGFSAKGAMKMKKHFDSIKKAREEQVQEFMEWLNDYVKNGSDYLVKWSKNHKTVFFCDPADQTTASVTFKYGIDKEGDLSILFNGGDENLMEYIHNAMMDDVDVFTSASEAA